MSWALCRETGNGKSCTCQYLWPALRKAKVLSDYTENLRNSMLDLCGMHRFFRVVFWQLVLSGTLRSKIRKPETKHPIFGNFYIKMKQWKELIRSGHIIIIGIELNKLYSIQRWIQYRVNHDVNERLLAPPLTHFDVFLFDISRSERVECQHFEGNFSRRV